jgi:flagellar motor protein MotB
LRRTDGEWQVRLPRRARSGPIYAECGERTNKAFLTVGKRPYPVLTARPRATSRWRLNAGASVARGGSIRWYRWEAGGRSLGWGKSITFEVGADRERRVTLAVGDSEGLDAVITVKLRGSLLRAYPADALFCIHCRRLSEQGRLRLQALQERAAEARKVSLHVHTDERGNQTRNEALSDARAQAMKRELLRNLRRRVRIAETGHGEHHPIATNAHRKNRRIVVVIHRTPAPDTSRAR